MKTNNVLTKLYRAAYIVGVAFLIASVALMWPASKNVSPASAQTSWDISFTCTGFTLEAPEHPDISIRSAFKAPGDTQWSDRQSWSVSAGGPDTYSFNFNPQPVDGSEILIRVFDAATNQTLYAEKGDCGTAPTDTPVPPTDTPVPPTDTPVPPTDTPVPPTDTPVPPTDTPVPPTDTPVPPTATPETPTATFTPEGPTVTPGGPTLTPTNTPVEPTPTQTEITSLPTPTFTAEVPTPTQTEITSLPTPTNTRQPNEPNPTRTPGGGSIPSPVPAGTQSVLIPVTGLDTSLNLNFLQRTLLNLGLGFLGIGLVLHGMSINGRRKE